jgi:ubiquinone/menaquinone biosynthesis C-methylase UbiE
LKNKKNTREIIETTGEKYNDIIFQNDYIPKSVYLYQIQLRNEFINKSIANKKFNYVLDIGCGTGFHINTLFKYADNLIGIDMSVGALKECKISKKDYFADFIVCDINYLPFKKNSIDCIWISGVLHHVPNDLENIICNTLAYIMKIGGFVLVDEPNKLNLFNYFNMKLSKADPTGEERPLSLSYVGNLLKCNNFEILRSEYYEFFSPIGILLDNPKLFKILNYMDHIIQRSFFKLILLRWNIYAKKLEDFH